MFTSDGRHVVASFNDATLVMWDVDSFLVVWRIQISQLEPIEKTLAGQVNSSNPDLPKYTAFAVSLDDELLAYYGLYTS
jgi:hypothetical protein